MLLRLQFRMVLVGTVVLLGWVGYLAVITAKDVYSLRERESAVRGLIVAESLANAIGRALGYGIAMDDLSGIDRVFAARMEDNQEVVEIVLDDLAGKTRVPTETPRRQGVSVSAVVKADGQAVGQVTVYLRDTSLWGALGAPVSAALLILMVVVLSVREAVRFSVRRGPGLRETAAMGLVRQISQQDFNSVVKEAHLKRLDLRSAWLSTQIRDLNERFTRLFRLIVSLRHTEPSHAEQLRLMALARQARGDAQFAAAKPSVKRLTSMAIDMRWLVFIATASVSVNLFMLDRLPGNALAVGPLMLGLGMLAALFGYAMTQRWLASPSAQWVCLGGLFLLGGTPLVFVVMSWLGDDGMQSSGQAILIMGIGMGTLGQIAVGCLQAMGLGIFFAGLRRFIVGAAQDTWKDEQLPTVVLAALAPVGAALAILWGSTLGSNGMMLLSSALAIAAYFFFAISAFPPGDSLREEAATLIPTKRYRITAAVVGFILGTVISTVVSGVFPAGRIETPQMLAWSTLAMGMGFLAQIRPLRLPESLGGMLALVASIFIAAGAWPTSHVGMPTSIIAVAILTHHLIRILLNVGQDLGSASLVVTLRWLLIGAVTSSLLYAASIYFGYAAWFGWGLSAAGCLTLMGTRGFKTAKVEHAA